MTGAQLQMNGVAINSEPLEVNIGENTTLICNVSPVTSKPTPTIVWYIGSSVMKSSTSISYTFTATETFHNQAIYCKAYNLQSASEAVESAKPMLFVRGNVYEIYIVSLWDNSLYMY